MWKWLIKCLFQGTLNKWIEVRHTSCQIKLSWFGLILKYKSSSKESVWLEMWKTTNNKYDVITTMMTASKFFRKHNAVLQQNRKETWKLYTLLKMFQVPYNCRDIWRKIICLFHFILSLNKELWWRYVPNPRNYVKIVSLPI